MREMSGDKELGQVSSPSNQMNNSDLKNNKNHTNTFCWW